MESTTSPNVCSGFVCATCGAPARCLRSYAKEDRDSDDPEYILRNYYADPCGHLEVTYKIARRHRIMSNCPGELIRLFRQ